MKIIVQVEYQDSAYRAEHDGQTVSAMSAYAAAKRLAERIAPGGARIYSVRAQAADMSSEWCIEHSNTESGD